MTSLSRRPAWLLFAVFCIVFLLNMGSLRIVWMDWSNLDYFRALPNGWAGIITNQWMANPRVQFLSWVIQALFEKCFGFWSAPYFIFSLGVHFACSLMVYRIMGAALGDEDSARASAALYLVFPTSSGALFVINNWFFVLSYSAAVGLVYLLMFPRRRRRLDLAALTGAALSCQFLGEQTIPLLYWVLLWFGAREVLRGPRETLGARLSRILLPLTACAATLLPYVILFVKPYAGAYPFHWSLPTAAARARMFALAHVQSIDLSSWMFGRLSVPPSFGTLFSIPFLMLALRPLFFHRETEPGGPRPKAWPVLVFLSSCLAATFLPVLVSALTGYRADVETRYLYCSGLIVALMAPATVELLSSRREPARRPLFRRLLYFGATVYLASLMLYDLHDIWGAQKRLDQRIWAAIDENIAPQSKYIFTDGLQDALLMPFNRSNAVSDFHEDFGVRSRMKVVRAMDITAVRRPRNENGDLVTLIPYRGPPFTARKAEIFGVVLRYEKRYVDLLNAKLHVFPKFDDYKKHRNAEGFTFADSQF